MSTDQCCDFGVNYEQSALPAVKALERDVLDCDFGSTSWTTRQQADAVFSRLQLTPESRLLEVGSGSGWPSLYLGQKSGCHVTLLDMPLIALQQAAERASEDDMDGRAAFINGDGTALPFADTSFDRLSQSDVLCCLPEKLEMLQECRRVATLDARFVFTVLEPAERLSETDHQAVLEAGPGFVEVSEGYSALLERSGWELLEQIDLTDEYARTIDRLIAGLKTASKELCEAYGGEDEIAEYLAANEVELELVRDRKLLRFARVAIPI